MKIDDLSKVSEIGNCVLEFEVVYQIPKSVVSGFLSALPDVQAGFRKGRGTRDQIANIHWIIEKAREFKKKTQIYFCFFDYAKAFDYVSTINCGKFFKRWEYQTI